ncbi:MAG: hypothetical protein ACSHX5_00335 [Phycisphaerales bacterium]
MRGPTEPNEFDLCYMRVDPKVVVKKLSQDDPNIRSLMVWHCKRFDVKVLRRFTELRSLRIAYWYGESLEALTCMPHLEHLHIYMLPRIHDFTPLGELKNLRALTLNAGVWSDLQPIRTYLPLSKLGQLSVADIGSFYPEDRRIDYLLNAPNLNEINLPDIYSLEELADAMRMRMDLKQYFEPVQSWCEMSCDKCGSEVVRLLGLYGTRRRKWACVKCHAKRIQKHKSEFEAVFEKESS